MFSIHQCVRPQLTYLIKKPKTLALWIILLIVEPEISLVMLDEVQGRNCGT